MKIENTRINHLENPVGYQMDSLSFSWIVKEARGIVQTAARVCIALDDSFREQSMVCDTGKVESNNNIDFQVSLLLEPRTRYYYQIEAWSDLEEYAQSKIAFFETGKRKEPWQATWIAPADTENKNPYLERIVYIGRKIVCARAYACGVGLYEFMINGNKVGEEYLLPGYHSYDMVLQYQTFDITDYLKIGSNTIGAILGDGWYKGRFGFEGGYENLYGDQKAFLCEIRIQYDDGSEEVIVTNKKWTWRDTGITFNNIYDGEHIDYKIMDQKWKPMNEIVIDTPLVERLNPPIKIMERRKALELIISNQGEKIIDFGQNMTGWVEIDLEGINCVELKLSFSELLQDGCFYNENLRTSRAEFICKGVDLCKETYLRPHFTFYGFRYVKVEGLEEINLDQFTACLIMSELEETGFIKTSNEKVNQLISNVKWGQKDNFLDIPTDCPQRDERMGWTGDTTVFASTACFNMYTPAFYHHYLYNLRLEQIALNGSVPFFVPTPKPEPHPGINPFLISSGVSTWGDVACVLPFTLYEFYGDKSFLTQHYPIMKDWVEHVRNQAKEKGNEYLWLNCGQLGDWLALDNGNIRNPIGKTDPDYIASIYYFQSVTYLAKASNVLAMEENYQEYDGLSKNIKQAIQERYFDRNGNLSIEETQTALALALVHEVYPSEKKEVVAKRLRELLEQNNMHLNTGFVGTPVLCHALSESGSNDLAYTLLLNETYPSWLYEVNLGATTIWERWNSLLSDGTISGTDMNSLNHYAYGCVLDWMYRKVCGFHPSYQYAGFQKMTIKPMPDPRLSSVYGEYQSAAGKYVMEWKYLPDGRIDYHIEIPFNASADVILGDGVTKELIAGSYDFVC